MQLSKSALMAKGGTAAGIASGLVVGTRTQVDDITGPIWGVSPGIYTVVP